MMRFIKLTTTLFAMSMFLMSCASPETQQTAEFRPQADNVELNQPLPQGENDYWAKENLDLRRVGTLLERSNSPREFETFLNSEDGINNFDLNGDGYVDYISVDEFTDRGDNERGLSLFSRFGPNLIQEIATIVFQRDNPASRGARVLLRGNDQIYGDNNYYETNWVERSVGIVNGLFGNRDQQYRSPYYYDNYPADYQVYEVVQTPVYRARVEQLYPATVFVPLASPTVPEIKIKSHHNGKWMDKVYARLAEPSREQVEFRQNNPNRPHFVRIDPGKKSDDSRPGDDRNKDERKADKARDKSSDRGNDGKKGDDGKHRGKPGKPDKGGKGKKGN